jgi:hypothetical protein
LPNKRQVGEAIEVARSLLTGGEAAAPPVPTLAGLARRFSAVKFDVPAGQDADGYLFQYGEADWLPEPGFVLSLARQLEVVDAHGEHESYLQVQFQYRYPMNADLEVAGSVSQWWFPEGDDRLDAWLTSLQSLPIGDLLRGLAPSEFVVWEDKV